MRKWTDEEFEELKLLAENGIKDKNIATLLGRTKKSIQSKRYKNNIDIITEDGNVFKELDKKTSWLLGFITGDGCISNKSKPNNLTIYNSNKKLLIKSRRILKAVNKVRKYNANNLGNKQMYRLQINSKEIMKDLKKLNCYGKKKERNPFEFVPEENKWNFIKGLFEADGNFYNNKDKNKTSLSIAGHKELIKNVYYWLCKQINKEPNKIYTSSSTNKTKYFSFTKKDILKLINELGEIRSWFDSTKWKGLMIFYAENKNSNC